MRNTACYEKQRCTQRNIAKYTKKMQFLKFTSTIDPVSKFNLLKWSDLAAAKEKGACEDIVFDCSLPAPRTLFVSSFSVILKKFLIK